MRFAASIIFLSNGKMYVVKYVYRQLLGLFRYMLV